jgi:hypothetical protein
VRAKSPVNSAEREGFEPSVPLRVHMISSRMGHPALLGRSRKPRRIAIREATRQPRMRVSSGIRWAMPTRSKVRSRRRSRARRRPGVGTSSPSSPASSRRAGSDVRETSCRSTPSVDAEVFHSPGQRGRPAQATQHRPLRKPRLPLCCFGEDGDIPRSSSFTGDLDRDLPYPQSIDDDASISRRSSSRGVSSSMSDTSYPLEIGLVATTNAEALAREPHVSEGRDPWAGFAR